MAIGAPAGAGATAFRGGNASGVPSNMVWDPNLGYYVPRQDTSAADAQVRQQAEQAAAIAAANLAKQQATHASTVLTNTPTNPSAPPPGPTGYSPSPRAMQTSAPPPGPTGYSPSPRAMQTSAAPVAQAPAAPAPVSVQSLVSQANQVDGSATPPPEPVYDAPPAPPPVAPIALPKHADEDPAARKAASDAAYASAKDKIGQTGRASLTALREEMGSRGIAASGLEGRETANLVSGMTGQLGQVSRDQSAEELARANAVADTVYGTESGAATANQGAAVATRGQDIGAATSAAGTKYSGALTVRGQTIGAQQANIDNRRQSLQALAALRSSGTAY